MAQWFCKIYDWYRGDVFPNGGDNDFPIPYSLVILIKNWYASHKSCDYES